MTGRRKAKKVVRHWKPQVRREIKILPATVISPALSADGDMKSTSPRRTFPWQSSIARTMGQSAIRSQNQKKASFSCHHERTLGTVCHKSSWHDILLTNARIKLKRLYPQFLCVPDHRYPCARSSFNLQARYSRCICLVHSFCASSTF